MTSRPSSLYVASVFLSAWLLFLLQPMLARVLLPVFGGSPAVWNTCMVFFQGVLLAGYAYAHSSLARLGVRRQRILHGALLVVSIVFLPRVLSQAVLPDAPPALSVLATLTILSAIPFFMLSSNSSLAQRWFSSATKSRDPFWLYAASNAGSLAALLAYPLVIEPTIGLRSQLRWWSMGYGVFVVLSFVTMVGASRTQTDEGSAQRPVRSAVRVTWQRRARWVALAAIASSLLLSVTMKIATDLLSTPLFWVIPLALYLATFVIAFSKIRRSRQVLAHLAIAGIALCFAIAIVPNRFPLWAALAIQLATLFVGALVCHGDIADDRPDAAALTDFYLWLAVGGMIGGVANSLIAPIVFTSVVEYPLTLACLAFVVRPVVQGRRAWVAALGVGGALTALAAGMVLTGHAPATAQTLLAWQLMPLLVLAAGIVLSTAPGVFAVTATLAALFIGFGLHFTNPVIDRGRSFFGVHSVTDNGIARVMVHGVTVHGGQFNDAPRHALPLTYYDPAGPLAAVVGVAPGHADIGVVGLGAGSLAASAHSGQHLTYFEIDPLVESMARRNFTYLRDSKARIDVRIGDGRRLLDQEPDDRYDLLVIDAFTSDAIPMHLLTDEAIAIYLRTLKPSGVLVVHISNRYADLSRVFRGWQRANGARVAITQFIPTPAQSLNGALETVAVAIGRSASALAPLAEMQRWFVLDDDGPAVRWTDDRASLLSVLTRNFLKP